MNMLFVCNLGENRSRTGAEIFSSRFNTRFGGLFSNLISAQDLEWAHLVIVMEENQRKLISKKFPSQYLQTRILNLDIPDVYRYKQPELIELLKQKFSQVVEPLLNS